MAAPDSAGTATPVFSSDFADQTRSRLRSLLGPTWERIEREDDPSQRARDRHLLAVLDENAVTFRAEFEAGRMPGHMPDFLALYVIVEILTRTREDPVFREVMPGLADRASFRHDMLNLGLADHIREHTDYTVRLPTRSRSQERIVDIILGADPGMDIETKSSEEFDGLLRHVSGSNAFQGIRNAWRRSYGGANPQLSADRASAILVGGVTVELGSLPTIVRVAGRWLERKGEAHPNCWGILAMTFLTYTRMPVGRNFGDGRPLEFTAHAGVQLAFAKNPYYTGSVQLVLTQPVW
jgi:hypothetical protein